jgi:hypothetical protein
LRWFIATASAREASRAEPLSLLVLVRSDHVPRLRARDRYAPEAVVSTEAGETLEADEREKSSGASRDAR